jgi:hypothetical protein
VAERDAEEEIVANRASAFDPYALLAALQARGVSFVVIGAFARVIHGTGELTDGLDVTPSMREENLSRLAKAIDDLDARRTDGEKLDLMQLRDPVIDLDTRAGELKLVPEPAGSHGYDDLRRHASHEPLGRGVRPQVASPGDLARMLGALEREREIPTLLRLRRVIELDRGLSRELSRGRSIER